MAFKQSSFLYVESSSNDSASQYPIQAQEWSDISRQQINPMMIHEPQTLQLYVESFQDFDSVMMDDYMSLPRNVTIAANDVKFEAKRPMLGPSGKPKRVRTNFTSEQLIGLEKYFANKHFARGSDRIQLSNELNLSEVQVKIWFQNRRMKFKREEQNKLKTTKTNQHTSDGDSRPSSNGSAASHRSVANDQEIRNNLINKTISNPQIVNNLQATEIDEGLQIETPDLNLSDNLFRNESSSNVAQQVLIDNNDISFIDEFLRAEPTTDDSFSLSDSFSELWNFKSELVEL